MNGEEFVSEMNEMLWQLLSVRDAALAGLKETVGRVEMPQLLKGALRNEMEAAQIAAVWLPSTPEVEARLAFARQAGDEAKHYQLIARRLGELGVDLSGFDPLAQGPTRLYRYLEGLQSSAERVAAAQFTREAIGYKSNQLFIAFCREAGDGETAEMYEAGIQPDEMHHHEWGRQLLARLAAAPGPQAAARKAITTTLELAEELRSLAAGRLLVEALPGC
jgi:1,2-phenylacetyl-CoA epoxidase catalytic subunit